MSAPVGLPLLIVAVFGAIGIIRARSRQHSRGYLRMYANDAYPIFTRNAIATYPIFLAGMAVFILAGAVPRSLGGWIAMVAIAIVEVAMFVSYRVPPPFLPRWMAEDIAAGRLEPARPERNDWILLWMSVVGCAAGAVAIPYLILTGPGRL